MHFIDAFFVFFVFHSNGTKTFRNQIFVGLFGVFIPLECVWGCYFHIIYCVNLFFFIRLSCKYALFDLFKNMFYKEVFIYAFHNFTRIHHQVSLFCFSLSLAFSFFDSFLSFFLSGKVVLFQDC